jgi:aspartate/glutamate racemase
MGRMVGMVHTLCSNVRLFNGLVSAMIPGVELVHIVDEGLSSLSGKQDHEYVIRRLETLSTLARESGAEAIVLTCTALGRLAEEVKERVNVPVFAVLEIIADEVADITNSIGVLGTHPGTVTSAVEIIQEEASRRGNRIAVKSLLCPGAFDAARQEDWETHDTIVLQNLTRLMEEVEVIVMPQPSMERVMSQAPEPAPGKLIVTSARLAVQRLKDELDMSLQPWISSN